MSKQNYPNQFQYYIKSKNSYIRKSSKRALRITTKSPDEEPTEPLLTNLNAQIQPSA